MMISYQTKDRVIEEIVRYASLLLEGDLDEERSKEEGIDKLVAQNEPSDEKPKNIVYGENPGQEIPNNYGPNIIDYLEIRQRALHDFTDRVPGKHIDIFPENVGGLLGYTFIGDVKMGRREDLIGDHETDIHECIHTTDEYETRILTSWIISKEKNDNYVR